MNAPAVAGLRPVASALLIPRYLEQVYWWAYVHPRAVRLFERPWLVNLILFGNYARLRDAALAALGTRLGGATLQMACVYGDLSVRLRARLQADAQFDVIDALPIQLANLAAKLPPDGRVRLMQGDAGALALPDAYYEQILLFFLLHEQPLAVRRATLAEALRLVKPGGRIVILDYGRPHRWHPLRPLMRLVFRALEPFAIELWERELLDYFPPDASLRLLSRQTYFGGLYQRLVLTR